MFARGCLRARVHPIMGDRTSTNANVLHGLPLWPAALGNCTLGVNPRVCAGVALVRRGCVGRGVESERESASLEFTVCMRPRCAAGVVQKPSDHNHHCWANPETHASPDTEEVDLM